MALFKGCKKEDLRHIAREINQDVEERMTILDLSNLIKESEIYKTNPQFVNEIAESILEERKREEQKQLELERLKLERSKNELELLKIKNESKLKGESEEEILSLDSLVKSIRTLTVKPPSTPDGWGFFFKSLERAFVAKVVPEKFRAEILLNLMGERASNVITYIKDEELKDYEKLKAIIIREFEPTAQSCLESFKRTCKLPQETYTQFVSRLTTSWEYYLKLRKVTEFKSLNELIVSDKLFSVLDRETAAHISVRQASAAGGFFDPITMAKEVELYLTSRGNAVVEENKIFRKNAKIKNNTKVFLNDVKQSKCNLCLEGNHNLANCSVYLKLSVPERINYVKTNRLCFLCLNKHMIASCQIKTFCSVCHRKHHISLHLYNRQIIKKNENPQESRGEMTSKVDSGASTLNPVALEFQPQLNANALMSHTENTVLLGTVTCYLLGADGSEYKFKAILDSGSEKCFISKRCAELLNLKQQKTNINVSGLNSVSLNVNTRVMTLMSNENKSYMRELEFFVVSKIMSDVTPRRKLKLDIQEFQNFNLADKDFCIPERPDIILGVEIFYELLRPGQFKLNNSNLTLQNTVFGFVVSGSTEGNNKPTIHCGLTQEETDLDETLKQFWEIEQVSYENPKGEEAIICEQHFKNNVTRDGTGRYSVQMPFKEDPSCLGESKKRALRCLNSTWGRMIREPQLLTLYKTFMEEYLQMGHMEKVEESKEPEICYYLPHHAVFRPGSTSTPLRVVFNASAQTSSGKSLNCIQYKGEVIQNDLFTIILNFRKFKFVFVADIKKMYRMIGIDQSQRNLLRILWKSDENEKIETYQLCTVTYGTTSAPYLATRTLKQLSLDEGQKFPLAASTLVDSCYMDDIVTGAQSVDEAKELQRQLIELLNCAGMSLHKWRSNDPEITKEDHSAYQFSNKEETFTLGVLWQHREDCFSFKVNSAELTEITKRKVLSVIARLFDPLGLLGPVIAKAKIFMQKLWLLHLNWNDYLPEREAEEWRKFAVSLQSISEVKIERCILFSPATLIEIHGFADASEAAYAAVIYCKSKSKSREVSIKLVTSKSRVSPIKKLTIPRLELCAAVLLAKLLKRVLDALKLDINQVILWSDSMIALSWLRKEPLKLKTFVANRVTKIQELTDVQQWRYVPTKENPADIISRGEDPEKLLQSELWWKGPQFLLADEYPNREIPVAVTFNDYCCELKKNCDSQLVTLIATNSSTFSEKIPTSTNHFVNNILNLSNNFLYILRVLSYLFRFCFNVRNPESKKAGPLAADELDQAETFLIKVVQLKEFSLEIRNLRKGESVAPNSKLRSLAPFLDEQGIIRVGGRLQKSHLNYFQKHPILLPQNSRLTILIVMNLHRKCFHVGPQTLLYHVREKYWPISARNLCRKICHECVICFKAKPVSADQMMSSLPQERVNQNFVFSTVGIDFCGPFFVKYKNQRKGVFNKVYVAIFICFCTRAIHLDIVTDLTTEAFIACLKRVFSRRGKAQRIFTDNSKTFHGANAELKRLHKMCECPNELLAGYLSSERVDWKFIPPRAPNFGGLWEAGVKSFKFYFKRIVGNSNLTLEEFLTVTVQIEGFLNSRPLYPMSSNPNDFEVLSPGHFLIGRQISSIVEPNLSDISESRLSKWQKITKMTQLIWKRWRHDYLNNLQQRGKWFFEKDNVKIGSVVLIKEENLPPTKWVIARIVEAFPGNDGKIRVVKLLLPEGKTLERSVRHICVLPNQ